MNGKIGTKVKNLEKAPYLLMIRPRFLYLIYVQTRRRFLSTESELLLLIICS
jgi:hypothetical protein